MGVGGQRHVPTTLPLGKTPGTHCIGGWVGDTASLDGTLIIYIYMRLFVLPNKESVDQQNFLSVMQMYYKFTQILGEESPSQGYGSNL